MTKWHWFWIVWASLGLMVFAIGEGIALTNSVLGDTLSEGVRLLLSTPLKIPFMILYLGTFGWLIIHWFFEKNPQMLAKIKGSDVDEQE